MTMATVISITKRCMCLALSMFNPSITITTTKGGADAIMVGSNVMLIMMNGEMIGTKDVITAATMMMTN